MNGPQMFLNEEADKSPFPLPQSTCITFKSYFSILNQEHYIFQFVRNDMIKTSKSATVHACDYLKLSWCLKTLKYHIDSKHEESKLDHTMEI